MSLGGLAAIAAAVSMGLNYAPATHEAAPSQKVSSSTKPASITRPAPAPTINPFSAQWLQLAHNARQAFDNGLIDYPSTRFRAVHGLYYLPGTNPTDFILCGHMNPKNRVGAYSGWMLFAAAYTRSGDGVQIYVDTPDSAIAAELCRGQGRAAEVREARDRAEEDRLRSGLTPGEINAEAGNVLASLHNLKPDPILPHRVDTETDYASEVSWHQ